MQNSLNGQVSLIQKVTTLTTTSHLFLRPTTESTTLPSTLFVLYTALLNPPLLDSLKGLV